MIRKLKYINKGESLWDVIDHNDLRYKDIKSEFKNRKKSLIEKNTKYVRYFENILREANIFFIQEKCSFSEWGDLFYSDIHIPSLDLTIEIDGGYHNTPERKYLDDVKEKFLRETKGLLTLRFENEDCLKIKSITKNELIDKAEKSYKNKDIREWRERVCGGNEYTIKKLKKQFAEKIKGADIDSPLLMYNKTGEKWVFDNIFDLHFSTGFKFKHVVVKVNNHSNRYKFNIKTI